MPMGSNGVGPYANTVTGRGFEVISLADGLVHTLTLPATPPEPFMITLQADGGAFRYRDDGTSPTAATGFLCADGGCISVQPSVAASIEIIADGTDTGDVNVIYHTASNASEA